MSKKHSRRIAGKLIGFVAVLLIVTAVVVQLGRMFAPLVSENRTRLENYLTEQLGARVQIGNIQARWDSLRPELSVDQVLVTTADGEQVLTVKHASAQLGLLLSLRDWDLRFWEVELAEVQVVFDQTPAGHWQLSGVNTPKSRSSSLDPVDAMLIGRHILFDDIHTTFNFHSGRQQEVGFTQLRLENDRHFHRLTADVDLPNQPDTVQLVYEGLGDPRDASEFHGDGYLKLDNYPLPSAVAFVSEDAAARAGIQDGLVSSEIWLKTRPEQPVTLQGSVNFHRTTEVNPAIPVRIGGEITGQYSSPKDWKLNLQGLQAFWRDQQSQSLSASLASHPDPERWEVQIPQLELAELSRELDRFSRFPEHDIPEAVIRLVGEFGATGTVSNIHVAIPKTSPMDFVLRANLQQVSVNDWKGAPEIRQLDGYLEASSLSGFVEIDSQEGLLMHFPQVYHNAFEFERAQGVVGWTVRPEDNQAQVYSNVLNMQGQLGEASGYFYLDAPLERNSRPTELMLQIGLQNGHAIDHKKLVPKVVPDSLLAWLDSSIVQGAVPSGGFLMEGYFGGGASDTRSVQVALNVADGELSFDPRWPVLQTFSGFLEIDDTRVQGWVDEGQFLSSALQPTYLEVGANPQGEGSLLQINGALSGDASAGLQVLTQTPIRDALGGALDEWSLKGDMKAEVQLRIPLKAGETGSRQQVDVSLRNADLMMQSLGLDFDRLGGDLMYSDTRGLYAETLSARLWDQSLALRIASTPASPSTPMNTDIHFKGPLDFARLASWSRRPELMFIEGVVPVSGEVSVASGEIPVRIQASSDLSGASIDLPAPYGKAVSEKRSLKLDIPVARNHTSYRVNYDNLVSVNIQTAKDQPVEGLIALGQPSQLHVNDGLWLDGAIDRLDAEQWWPVVQRYQTFAEQFSSGVGAGELSAGEASTVQVSTVQTVASSNLNLQLFIEEFSWGEVELKAVQVGGGQRKQGWRIRLDDDRVKGAFFLADDGRPLNVELDYIRWPALESGSAEGADPAAEENGFSQKLSSVQPQDIPAVDFSVGELSLGDKHYGRWSFQARPDQSGLVISNLLGSVNGVHVSAREPKSDSTNQKEQTNQNSNTAQEQGASLIWRKGRGKERTRFYGKLSGGNLANISDAWELPRMMDSKSVELDVNLLWPGNPAEVSVADLQGKMKVSVQDGRFYRSTGQASNALLRLVGLFNFDSWIRRLQLDFSDVFKGGTPFESVAGEIQFEKGIVYLTQPMEVRNTSSVLKMGGKINLPEETLDTSLVATLPVGGNATLIAAFAGGLPAAAGVYAISKIFKKQMERVASVSYSIKGSWSDPAIEFDKLFDNKAAQQAADDSREAASEGKKRRRKANER
ncbi:YhdP family protein [Pseudomaricurvus sp.]|uniref:YhdP family protein n=1 Tax=Pseudomaricurvus sp. TaxID=2004510 RepID=UPI003F6CE57D